jgi:hypothetical protein
MLGFVSCDEFYPQPKSTTNGMKFPVKVISMGIREDVGFNGTKFNADGGILLLDSNGILYYLHGPAYMQLVKGETIILPEDLSGEIKK